MPSHSFSQETKVIDGVTYDVVTITVDAPSYDNTKPPVFARVKYNKLCPLVITSDDMGRVEFVRNWAYFNGYPVFSSNFFGQLDNPETLFEAPYNTTTQSWQEPEMAATSWQPLTYSDGTGGVRRFTATSAIMPYKIKTASYNKMNTDMAKAMVRTGWSFAQHDVADNFNDIADVNAYIKEQLPVQSDIMKDITGYGIKIMVEPNGDHRYIKAAIETNDISWIICQSAPNEYPSQSKLISDWTDGSMPTTFTNKPVGAWERFFFQSHESTLKENYIDTADETSMILGGTHGITNSGLAILKDLSLSGSSAKKDQFWVGGADEVWEYYYLYNNAKITVISYNDEKLTFQVKVPQYKKHQFRELTINIPGVTGGTACTFSGNVITGSAAQNTGKYTINLGLENNIYTYIEELITYYRSHLHNEYVKRDAQYLIDLLAPGDTKNNYQARLNAEPNYSYTIKATSSDNVINDELASGISDVPDNKAIPFPKYILKNNTLYQTTANIEKPYYVTCFTLSGENEQHLIEYNQAKIENVVFYSEGEQLPGTTPITDVITTSKKGTGEPYHALMQASNGIGGALKKGSVNITTLQPGIYTLVAGVGDTWHDATKNATFTFKLGDKTVYHFTTDASGVKEYVKTDIIVKNEQTLSVSAENTGNARWLDYVYLIKLSDYDPLTPDVELISTNNNRIKISDNETQVTLTATATPHDGATITNIVIKDDNGNIVASNNGTGSECSYTFISSTLGTYKFSAEATDDANRKGVSDELSINVCSDLSYTVTASTGKELFSVSYSNETAAKNIIYSYPRYLLKGTMLYEAEANSTNASDVTNENKSTIQPHYGENMTLSSNGQTHIVNFTRKATNIIFYSEGENITGTETKRGSINNSKGDGELYWTYFLASDGAGTHIKTNNTKICDLPAGKYRLTAGIGDSWNNETHSATFTFKQGDKDILTAHTTKDKTVEEFTSGSFIIPEAGGSITVSATGSGNARWLDYIYIQEIPAPLSIDMRAGQQWASWYGDYDYAKPIGTEAYIATGVDNGNVTVSEIGAIPAHTGVLLKRTNANEAAILTSESGLIDDVNTEGNLLRGGTPTSYTDYVLQDNAFVLWGGGSLAPHRCYLPGGSISGSRVLTIGDNVTTVPQIKTEGLTTTKWYNLQGIPANEKPKKNGLYIFNRKKIIIK